MVKEFVVVIFEMRWILLVFTILKCNIDGSWLKETGVGEVGWLLRDY